MASRVSTDMTPSMAMGPNPCCDSERWIRARLASAVVAAGAALAAGFAAALGGAAEAMRSPMPSIDASVGWASAGADWATVDPGFGHAAAGGQGSRVVLEVRSHKVPFILEHGQIIGRRDCGIVGIVPLDWLGHGLTSRLAILASMRSITCPA